VDERAVVNGAPQSDAFLDLRDRVNNYWDRGLLGVSVDPARGERPRRGRRGRR